MRRFLWLLSLQLSKIRICKHTANPFNAASLIDGRVLWQNSSAETQTNRGDLIFRATALRMSERQ